MNQNKWEKTFLHNVAWLRRHFGLSKKEMAQRLGIGLHSLNKIECGELPAKLGVEVLFRIDREFGIDPQTLLEQELR